MSEPGDNKVIGNFRKLIDEVSADPGYDPANDKLKVTALETQYTAGDGSDRSYIQATPDRVKYFAAFEG